MVLVGTYFATYFAIGFVYPMLSGGNTVLGTMARGNDAATSHNRHDCQQYYQEEKVDDAKPKIPDVNR